MSELLARLYSFNRPELKNREGMVCEIWEDGEITLQKSGPLYGQRNLHMIEIGIPGVNIPMPDVCGSHTNMAIPYEQKDEVANLFRECVKASRVKA